MKILCMTYEFPPIGGGGSRVAYSLAAELAARGHSIDTVTSGMEGLPEKERLGGVDVHRIRCVRRNVHYATTLELATSLWPSYARALSLHRRHNYDVNHTHFALPSGLVSYLLYKKTGLPYVLTIHGSDVPGYNPDRFRLAHILARPVWRRVVLNAARVVSASDFLRRLLQEHIDVPVDIIRNGYGAPYPPPNLSDKKNQILVVTRMFRRKGVQHFLDALTGLDHDWRVVVAGDGPYLPTLKQKVAKANLNVDFVGFVQGEELLRLYDSSKIFVFPSLQENFPTVLLEAMHAGCAVITTNADGCGEVIGDAGIVTDPCRSDQIRSALSELIANPDTTENLGQAALNRIESFRWPKIAADYQYVFHKAASQTRYLQGGEPRAPEATEHK